MVGMLWVMMINDEKWRGKTKMVFLTHWNHVFYWAMWRLTLLTVTTDLMWWWEILTSKPEVEFCKNSVFYRKLRKSSTKTPFLTTDPQKRVHYFYTEFFDPPTGDELMIFCLISLFLSKQLQQLQKHQKLTTTAPFILSKTPIDI